MLYYGVQRGELVDYWMIERCAISKVYSISFSIIPFSISANCEYADDCPINKEVSQRIKSKTPKENLPTNSEASSTSKVAKIKAVRSEKSVVANHDSSLNVADVFHRRGQLYGSLFSQNMQFCLYAPIATASSSEIEPIIIFTE